MRPSARFALLAGTLAILLALAPAMAAGKRNAPRSWPPAPKAGALFVHFGEEHVNDNDGKRLLTKVVRQSVRYRPDLVTMSGDKANDGQTDQFELWSDVMDIYDRRGVPWLAGVGNHDRTVPSGVPGGTFPLADLTTYEEFFAGRPYPMGDARPYPKIRAGGRSADPDGAASHYFADVKGARWIFIDNSCFSIVLCDSLQNPSGQNQGGSEGQYDFLERVASQAQSDGKLAFVVMHMPTQDPRDQLYADPTSVQHTMGKGPLGTLDNTLFEQAAAASGVDGVFVGHIKGQFLYKGQGEVPYYIDGGAGGELYTEGPVGTDHGYWHGYRTIAARRGRIRTDVVPIFVKRSIRIPGSRRMEVGEKRTFAAFGRQPVVVDPAKVEALELRDPNPTPRSAGGSGMSVPPFVLWLGPPLLLGLALAGRTRRLRIALPALGCVAAFAVVGVSSAQQSEPTSTPTEALPNPARIWTSSNPKVLKPIASETDDPRRNRRTQTADGTFRARCPGKVRLRITSGFETKTKRIRVKGKPATPKAKRRCRAARRSERP